MSEVWQPELDLLPPDPWGGGAPELPVGAMQPADEKPGSGGRQLGSVNKRAEDLTSYIARRYGDPLERLARTSAQSLPELALACGVPRLVAFDFRCAVERLLARYVEAAPAKPVMVAASRGSSPYAAAHFAAAAAMGGQLAEQSGTPAERLPAELGRSLPADPARLGYDRPAHLEPSGLLIGLPPRGPD